MKIKIIQVFILLTFILLMGPGCQTPSKSSFNKAKYR